MELTLDSVRSAEGVNDSLTDTETFAMQGALGVIHAVLSDKHPDRLLCLWDMYKIMAQSRMGSYSSIHSCCLLVDQRF
jgi:hypothetical protein